MVFQSDSSASGSSLAKLVDPYVKKFNDKLEDILLEFESYNYTYQALLTQAEFEEEFMPIIGKLFRRNNKYDAVYEIFDTLISRSMRDLHKLLCLIDFMINISRYDPTVFKKLPNAIMSKVAEHPVFSKIEQYVYNIGRMNYKFKRFNSKNGSTDIVNGNLESSSGSEDEAYNRAKHVHVSLAELTSKIMSQTKAIRSFKKSKPEEVIIKEEEEDDIFAARLMDDNEDSDDEQSYSSNKKNKLNPSSGLVLKGLAESDSAFESDSLSESDSQSEDEEDNELEDLEYNSEELDLTMSNATNILEHNIDFNSMNNAKEATRALKRRLKKKLSHSQSTSSSRLIKISSKALKRKKSQVTSKKLKRRTKSEKSKSQGSRRTYYVMEKDLDFVFDNMFAATPKLNPELSKNGIKGFIYKPAQFKLFENMELVTCGMEPDIAKKADEILNTFIFQQAKRAGGCEVDSTQFVHPFEYDYIIKNFELIKEEGKRLPPVILCDKYGSLYNENGINKEFNITSIKNTKVKGLIQLTPFKTEEEYFKLFKKIVSKDQVGSRILFLNKLVTDGKSIFVFDLMDNILKAVADVPRLMENSEPEEEDAGQHQQGEDITETPEKANESFSSFLQTGGISGKVIEKDLAKEADKANTTIEAHAIIEEKGENALEQNADDVGNVYNSGKLLSNVKLGETENKEMATNIATYSCTTPTAFTTVTTETSSAEVAEVGKLAQKNIESSTSIIGTTVENADIAEKLRKQLQIKNLIKTPGYKTKLRIDGINSDPRETEYVSSKGISVPTRCIKKVLSTQERFVLLALLLFPGMKFDSGYEGLSSRYIKAIGDAFDGFRPYLLSLMVDDHFEFLRLPKYFKVDSTMFELQVQYLKDHPGKKRTFINNPE